MSAAEESNAAAAAPEAASTFDLAVTVGVIVVAADADDKRRREVATAAAMAAAEAGSASTSMGRIGDTTPEMLLLGRERSLADSSAMPSCSSGTRLLLCRCTDRPATGAGGGVLPTGVTEKGIAVRRGFELLGRISMNVPAAAAAA